MRGFLHETTKDVCEFERVASLDGVIRVRYSHHFVMRTSATKFSLVIVTDDRRGTHGPYQRDRDRDLFEPGPQIEREIRLPACHTVPLVAPHPRAIGSFESVVQDAAAQGGL